MVHNILQIRPLNEITTPIFFHIFSIVCILMFYITFRVLTDAEGLQDFEHDGARARTGPSLPGRSPRLVIVRSTAVLQLDGPPRSSGVPATPSSASRFSLRPEDAKGRVVYRTRPVPGPDDPGWPRIRPRNLRHRRRQGQRRRSRRPPRENHVFLLDFDHS